jgi:hypothetical protein
MVISDQTVGDLQRSFQIIYPRGCVHCADAPSF